jgi:pimeloyl-ACP methyl ester carboxylesterase
MTNGAPCHQPELPASKPKPFLLMRNRANQCGAGAVFPQDGYTISVVEFDDQGVLYDRDQLTAMVDALDKFRGQKPIIIVFTHGWRHDGRSDDDNLQDFCQVLRQVHIDAPERPVFGVFAAWRGLSWHGPPPPLEWVTVWSRGEAALRIALGSIREMFGRLRSFRKTEPGSLLVLIGHSFGGLITYSAVAQSLIEAAATPAGEIVPSFADLVLLVNPAFEATRYLPIFSQIKGRSGYSPEQLPVFVSVTAYNDMATGVFFPIAAFIPALSESTRWGTGQRRAVLCTMGHIGWMRTHELSAPGIRTRAWDQPRFKASAVRTSAIHRAVATPGVSKTVDFHGGARLTHLCTPGFKDPNNPFWTVGATKQVVDEHNGIFKEVFVEFVYDLVAAHVIRQQSRGSE